METIIISINIWGKRELRIRNKNKIRTSEAEISKKISTLSLGRNLLVLIKKKRVL